MDSTLRNRKIAIGNWKFGTSTSHKTTNQSSRHSSLIFATVVGLLTLALLIPSGYAATNDSVTVTVNCSPNPILYGSTTSCTVTLTDTAPTPNNGAPQGTVTFTVSPTGGSFSPSATCTLSTSGAETSTCSVTYSPSSSGSKTITGTYTRSSQNWQNGVAGSTTLTVSARTTSTSVSCSPTTILAGTGTACAVTVIDTGSGTPITPTGMISMSSSRSGTFTACSLSGGSGTSTCTSTYTPGSGSEGSITVTATYPGDAPHSGSSNTANVTSTIRASSMTLVCTPFPDAVGAPATCTATVSDSSSGTTFTPTGTVTFSDSPAGSGTSSSTCSLSGGSCSIAYTPNLGNEGSIDVSGVYGGDTDHTGSSSTFSITVVERSTSTTITCNSVEVLLNQTATCSVTVTDTSGGTKITPSALVTFQDSPASSGTLSSQSCNPTGSGGTATCSFTYQPSVLGFRTLFANYTGEPDLIASSGSVAMNSYDFTITVTPGSTVLRGTSGTYTITLKLVAGSTGTIPADLLTVLGLPSDATFTFTPTSRVPTSGGANSTLTVNVHAGPTGSLGDFSLTIVGSDPSASGGSHSAPSTLGIYDYSITITPSSEAILRGDQANYTVTITLASGSSTTALPSTILLTLTGAPASSTASLNSPVSFPPNTPTPTTTSLTVDTSGSTPGGTFTLTVTGSVGSGSRTGIASLTVIVPAITLNPTSGIVGSTVTVSGTNFADFSTVTITYGSTTVATATTDASGLFSVPFIVPASVFGPHTITATDSLQHAALATYTLNPSISLSPANGIPGTVVTVTGAGFAASSTTTIKYDGTTQPTSPTTITTNTAGSFTATFTVPGTSTNGAHTVAATDASAHVATTAFNIIAAITLNPTSGRVGTTVTVTGTGFSATSTITVKYDGTTQTTTPATITTNSLGSFSATFTVPASTNGAHTVTATDAASHSATASFTVTAFIVLAPTSGAVGSSFTVTGSGFSGSSAITVTFDLVSIGSASTSNTGAFTLTLTVPSSTVGPHTVTATDAFSHSASATLTLVPGITLSPTSGAVGSLVIVSGTSFTANSMVTITYASGTVATVSTDSSGVFSASFNVPASTFGAHTVTATDTQTQTASAIFSVTSSISLSPTQGSVSTTVTVTGTGFAASSTITIKYDGTTQTTSPTTVASSTIGSFSATFSVPISTNGAHTVTSTDVSAHTGSATFSVTASISLSPTTTIVGGTVTVTGTGFASSSTITVKYDGVNQPTSPTTITSSSTGTFSATFTVPASIVGSHTVTAVDALGNTGSGPLTIVASVTESITISVASGVPTNTGTISGCSVNPTTIAFDANPHTVAALPSCTITITVPADGINTRFRFAGPATTTTLTTCSSGTCPPAVVITYYQLLNTYVAAPTNPTTWDAPLSITVTGTISGLSPNTGCTINTANGGGSASCSGWLDYNMPVTVTSPAVISASERWASTTTNTFTDITAGLTHTVNYSDQFQVSLAASPSTGGTTTPSGTTGWLSYGSTFTVTEAPATGFTFTAWTSSTTSITFSSITSASTTLTVRGGGTVTANFVKGLDCFASGSSASPSSIVSVVLSSCRSNDVIIIFLSMDNNSPSTSVTDTSGLSWARRATNNQGSSQIVEEWWGRVGASNITIDTITASGVNGGSGNHRTNIIAVGISGIISAGNPFDTNTGLPYKGSGGSGQPVVTGVSTSDANDIIIAIVGSTSCCADTSGVPYALITSQGSGSGEVSSAEYDTVSSTLNGATVTFDVSSTSATHWSMMVDALQRVSAQIAQPVTITTIGTGIDSAISLSGCNVVPGSVVANGAQTTLAVDPSCTVTFTVQADTANSRYRFSNSGNPSTTWTVTACGAGTCTPVANNVYYQLLQTLSYSVSGSGSPASPTFTSMQLNVTKMQPITTTATGFWFDNGADWNITDPITGAAGERWQIITSTQADAGTISSAQTMVFVYYHQYFLTVNSPQDTPTPGSGWFNATSTIIESVTSPVSGGLGIQYVVTGWTGTGSVPSTGSSGTLTFTINAASSITWNWQLQYLLTIGTNGLTSSHPTTVYLNGVSSGTSSDTTPLTLWLNSGASTGTIGIDVTVSGGPGTGYFFTLWEDSSTSNPRASNSMTGPITHTATYGVDTTGPLIVSTETPGANPAGWNNVSVTISWSVSDPESGITSSSGCAGTTLTSETSGMVVTCSATNGAGLTSSNSVTVKIDKTNPAITGSRSPSPNSNGWNNGDVTVAFSCIDGLSGVAVGPVSPQIVTTEGSGQSRSATCTDNAGNSNSATVSGINIDKTPPVIGSSRSSSPNSNGWYNGNVTVSFTCSDPLSGVFSTPPPTTLGEGASQSATGTCLDNAGNSASASETGINIDLTLPSITGTQSPLPNAFGWNNGNVTVSYACNDLLSGVDTVSNSTTVSGDGQGLSATGNCIDKAGNTNSFTLSGINIDTTPPTITSSRSSQPNANQWYSVPVTVSFACTDALSQVQSSSSPTTLSEGGGQSVIGTCLDNAGNSASKSETNINVDLTAPIITSSRSVQPNANGWNNVAVTVSFSCSDALSGVSSVSNPTTVGQGQSQSTSGTCLDLAGNQASTTESNLNVDLTSPSITGSRSPGANSFGWNNASVTVSFTCLDSLSGVDSSSSPTVLDSQGVSQSVTGNCVDMAGNLASTTVSNINIDFTPPSVTSSRSVQPNINGWNHVQVTVSFSCTDALSGANSVSGPTTLGEGQGQSVIGFCADRAGNPASLTETNVNIDLTPPTITGSLLRPPNVNGWVNSSDPVAFTCSDTLSSVAFCNPPATPANEGAGQSVIGFATDLAGNNATVTVSNINIDKTPPVITASRNPQANSNGWTNAAVTVSFSCSDPISGVDSYSNPMTVSTEGQAQSITGNCTDKAGNSATVTESKVNIDLTLPTVTWSRNPQDLFGGTFGPVTVTFICTDPLSGVANVTEPVTLGNGPGQSVTGTCTDGAGNQAFVVAGPINVGLNTSLLLLILLIIASALSTFFLIMYRRRRRSKFIWDLPSATGAEDPLPKGSAGAALEGETGGPS